jgi:hypothetical protein
MTTPWTFVFSDEPHMPNIVALLGETAGTVACVRTVEDTTGLDMFMDGLTLVFI